MQLSFAFPTYYFSLSCEFHTLCCYLGNFCLTLIHLYLCCKLQSIICCKIFDLQMGDKNSY
ncbi:sucrose synthase 4 [Iris pallida]|uniref:Sucrose synthase 4 n=1 Tax=Iris pallida TaxID=29817 RepID=A0AAX6F4D8_IRIPA|nr:sucrose synthase 4 [Iris pallida]